MISPEALGLIAGALTSTGFIPQLLKALKSKSTKDISLPMLLIIFTGVILWLIYGLIIKDLPIILANALTTALISAIIILKVRYK